MQKRYLVLLSLLLMFAASSIIFHYRHHLSSSITSKIENDTQVNPRILPKEVIVTLNNDGFSPNNLTIQTGGAVRFVNQSLQNLASVNSDDYPTNRKYPELNLGVFQKTSTLVHIFTNPGTYTYHNQFHPEQKGIIIVN